MTVNFIKYENGGFAIQIVKDIFYFVSEEKIEEVKKYLENNGDPNAKDEVGRSLLYHATKIRKSRYPVLKLLVKHGVDVNITIREVYDNKEWFNTPLHIAARQRKNNIVKMLLKAGADVNAKNSAGDTALQLVLKEKYKNYYKDNYDKYYSYYKSTIDLLKAAENKTN